MLIAIENGTGNALYAGGDLYFGNGYLQGSMGMDSHLTPDNCTLVDVSYHPPYIVTDDTGVEKTITPDNILSPDPWMGGGAWAFDGSRFVLTDYGKKQIEANEAAKAEQDAKVLEAKYCALWSATDTYVTRYLSSGALSILALGCVLSKPKCRAVAAWSGAVWAEYYKRKSLISLTSKDDLDFTPLGAMPYSVPEMAAEVGMP